MQKKKKQTVIHYFIYCFHVLTLPCDSNTMTDSISAWFEKEVHKKTPRSIYATQDKNTASDLKLYVIVIVINMYLGSLRTNGGVCGGGGVMMGPGR
jgi:hypothetical protein